jgi:tRNA (cmo5U34)-methyltransferase
MQLDAVRAHFDREAEAYDEQILRMVPQYREQGEIMLQVLPFDGARPLRVLDLGCGTGVLSALVLAAFPAASVVACDLSARMLDICRRRLERFGTRAAFWQADFGDCELGEAQFELVISGLAIHHLEPLRASALYKRIQRALRSGGMFVNRELVLGATASWTRRYEALWRQHVASDGELDAAWFQQYLDEDRPASVDDHLDWLRDAGFAEVACHYRRFNFAVVSGSKT